MSKPRRISIVGATGSGKTFLARELAHRLCLPLHELDSLYWDETGRQVQRHEFAKRVAELVAADQWIIDGHYRDVRHVIWSSADTVVLLNYSPAVILVRLAQRFGRKLLGARPSASRTAAPGSLDRSSLVKVTWGDRIARFARTLRERQEYRRLLASPDYAQATVVELKTIRATARWLDRQGR
jgi:adenylate kinase family enzyme